MNPNERDDKIDAWHESDGQDDIWDALGLTQGEYRSWVENPSAPTAKPGKYDFILVDSMSMLHRAAHTYATLGFMAENGEWVFTGPVYGFLQMAITVWEKYAAKGCEVYFCWDAGYQHRLELYPEYKANRRKKKESIDPQEVEPRADLRQMESALRKLLYIGGFRQAVARGYEADDVLATLGKLLGKRGRVALYTIDQDLHQSVEDSVHVVSGLAGKEKIWTPSEVVKKWGLLPERVAEMKGMIGDGGDNIPGCPGCGMGWAQKLFRQYGGIENIISAATSGSLSGEYDGKKWKSPSLTTAVAANADLIRISWELAKVVSDAPVSITTGARDDAKLREVMNQLRFHSMLEGGSGKKLDAIRGVH